MQQEVLDLYDDNFNKINKTIIRRVDEIPNGTNIIQSYILIKNALIIKKNYLYDDSFFFTK